MEGFMPFELLNRIAEDCRKNSDITEKYFVQYSWYGKTFLDGVVAIENSAYEQLTFFPRCSYGKKIETTKSKSQKDWNGFCLELNQDEKIGYSRFVIGVRKEQTGPENSSMNTFIERIGTKNVEWFMGDNNPHDKQMKPFHWKRWCFLGDPNQYCQPTVVSLPSSFEDLILNHALTSDFKGFKKLLFDWLLRF